MNSMSKNEKSKKGIYLLLVLVLAACVWIGWQDFDLQMSQEVVRENIRSGIRGTIQLAVQYFIPINILVYFVQEIVAKRRAQLVETDATN